MAKIVTLAKSQVEDLDAGKDVEIKLSPKRTLILTRLTDLERKKIALEASYKAKLARLEQ